MNKTNHLTKRRKQIYVDELQELKRGPTTHSLKPQSTWEGDGGLGVGRNQQGPAVGGGHRRASLATAETSILASSRTDTIVLIWMLDRGWKPQPKNERASCWDWNDGGDAVRFRAI